MAQRLFKNFMFYESIEDWRNGLTIFLRWPPMQYCRCRVTKIKKKKKRIPSSRNGPSSKVYAEVGTDRSCRELRVEDVSEDWHQRSIKEARLELVLKKLRDRDLWTEEEDFRKWQDQRQGELRVVERKVSGKVGIWEMGETPKTA